MYRGSMSWWVRIQDLYQAASQVVPFVVVGHGNIFKNDSTSLYALRMPDIIGSRPVAVLLQTAHLSRG